jgi:sulfite reductase alpha subunit-like flavoprotein
MEHLEITLSRQNSIVDNLAGCSTTAESTQTSQKLHADNDIGRDVLHPLSHTHLVFIAQILAGFVLLGAAMLIVNFQQMRAVRYYSEPTISESQTRSCAQTCRWNL